jgi:hypothetical protein
MLLCIIVSELSTTFFSLHTPTDVTLKPKIFTEEEEVFFFFQNAESRNRVACIP